MMKKFLVVMMALLILPAGMKAKIVEESFEAPDFAADWTGGTLVSGVSSYDGTDSHRFTSTKTYPKVLRVVVEVGVGDYLNYPEEYSTGATVSVNGQEQGVSITTINKYQGSTSNLEMETLVFTLNEENTQVTLGCSLSNGKCDFYFSRVTVIYDDGEEGTKEEIYDLTVGGVKVTKDNRLDVLGDGGSVQYDGTGMLVLNNVKLSGTNQDIEIGASYYEFVIYLKGDNSIISGNGNCIQLRNTYTALTFTTEGNEPGSLYLYAQSQSPYPHYPINGTDYIYYEQNLGIVSGSVNSSSMTIRTAVKPLVNISATERIVSVPNDKEPSLLKNNVYNDVLYTLNPDHGDCYDETIQGIRLHSTMIDTNVDGIVNSELVKPGSALFPLNFNGITFMVPAGTGNIIIDLMTGTEGVLNVHMGHHGQIYEFPGNIMKMTRHIIPYEVKEATYVFVYNNSAVKEDTNAADHRAGKKTTVTVGVGSVGVGSSVVAPSNPNNGDATGIVEVQTDTQRHPGKSWYSIDGKRLEGSPTQKGLYIWQGKKVVI